MTPARPSLSHENSLIRNLFSPIFSFAQRSSVRTSNGKGDRSNSLLGTIECLSLFLCSKPKSKDDVF